MIKLIALDLDGTTLKKGGKLTAETAEAIGKAIDNGTKVVIATGRVFSALPKIILGLEGLRYIITSNGAVVTDLQNGSAIYTNFIDEKAVMAVLETLRKYDFMVEAFANGDAYMEEEVYYHIKKEGSPFNNGAYLLTTRKPIRDLFKYIYENRASMENINLSFTDPEDKAMMRNVLSRVKNISTTSAFAYNLEICGLTTSKADALKHLSERLGIKREEIMACGDSENDIDMLKYAGIPVAVANASEEVKAISKYISPSNEENGVAAAIEKFVL
ncbi:MAG TPA: HAD family hydrolase [Anaerovoracaceae bacterium]|nr:HAD family hydrolase [Anaerovoracaceae bacterium]